MRQPTRLMRLGYFMRFGQTLQHGMDLSQLCFRQWKLHNNFFVDRKSNTIFTKSIRLPYMMFNICFFNFCLTRPTTLNVLCNIGATTIEPKNPQENGKINCFYYVFYFGTLHANGKVKTLVFEVTLTWQRSTQHQLLAKKALYC